MNIICLLLSFLRDWALNTVEFKGLLRMISLILKRHLLNTLKDKNTRNYIRELEMI